MLFKSLSRTLLVALAAAAAGCVLYGDAEEVKTCAEVVCGANASCGDNAECYCEAGFMGNPYDGCKDITADVDETCKADCGQNAYCSEGECYCELDHVAVCGANSGCLPESRLCDTQQDCPNNADEAVAACGEPIYQEWLLTDLCDDSEDIEWRLYAQDRDWVWPMMGDSFFTTGYNVDVYQTVQCFRGEWMCFAGAAGDNKWGFNLDGTGECENCCAACGSQELLDIGYLECNG